MAGFFAHLVLPFSSHAQKTAFTRWLDHNIVATGDENEIKLRNTIRQLPEKTGNFWVLIQEASDLVANHKEEFSLKVNLPESSDNQVSSWLVGQWNVFQHQNTGKNAVLSDSNHAIQKWISSNNLSKTFLATTDKALLLQNQIFEILRTAKVVVRSIAPLKSGISINAP